MKKLNEVCKSIGVSKRTLHYYDEIGLLSPSEYTESGYRLYDDLAVEKLWTILLLKELGYPLKDIKKIMEDPNFDLRNSIEKQIKILTKKKERLEQLIGYASMIKMTGIIPFNFEEYGDITFDEFIEDSKKAWNMNMSTEEDGGENNPFDYESIKKLQQFIEEHLKQPEKELNEDEINGIAELISSMTNPGRLFEFQECIDEFKNLIDKDVNSKEVQEYVGELYDHINHLFDRSMSLNGFSLWGQIFASGGDFGVLNRKNLGDESADFIAEAIQIYCNNSLAGQK
ncbi:MAG: MerR family transcriptional regulator [Anaerolineales bacterium]|nr:MerR family transcriptional regulator [Anaerolineales bacterium]